MPHNPEVMQTIEVSFKVKKRDGSLEKYDPEKIKRVVIAAGLSEKQADILCDEVNKWALRKNRKIVTSLEIKDQVSLELKKLDDYAFKKYQWYQDYKDRIFKKS